MSEYESIDSCYTITPGNENKCGETLRRIFVNPLYNEFLADLEPLPVEFAPGKLWTRYVWGNIELWGNRDLTTLIFVFDNGYCLVNEKFEEQSWRLCKLEDYFSEKNNASAKNY